MAKTSINFNQVATVANLKGAGLVRHPDGSVTALKNGMALQLGDVVVTQPGAYANIMLAEGGSAGCGGENGDAMAIDKTALDFFSDDQDVKVVATDPNAIANDNGNAAGVNLDNLEATAAGAADSQASGSNFYVIVQPISTYTAPTPYQNLNGTTNTAPPTTIYSTSNFTPLANLISPTVTTTPTPSPELLIAKSVVDSTGATWNNENGDTVADSGELVVGGGDTVTYLIQAFNAGNLTLTNVHIYDSMLNADTASDFTDQGYEVGVDAKGYFINAGTIEIGSTFEVRYLITVTQDLIDSGFSIVNGSIVNIADATSTEDPDVTDATYTVLVDVVELPAINVTKTADITSGADVGDVITYTIVVTNTGNETLTNVTVVDPLTGMSETITSLAPSASSTFTTTYTVTQADIDDSTGSNSGVDGDIDNTVTADSDQTGPDTASAEVTLDIRPGLSVTKVADVTSVNAVGDVITYTIVVTNTGNETLTNVTVVDPLTGMSETITSLAPSASSTFTTTYTVTQADIDDSTGSNSGVDGDIDNTVTADSDQTDSVEDSEVVDVVELPAINVTKTADITSGADVGDVITYTIVVTNTGNETLTNVTVVDPLTGMSETITSLAPSASSTFTTTYTVTQADIDDSTGSNSGVDGDIDNTVTADSDQTGPDTASAEVTLDIRPGLSVTKVADVTSVNAVGDVITYTIVVTNTGNETLTNVTVVDPLTGMSETITSLAPSASSTFTTTYTVTQADIDDSTGSNSGVDGDIDNTVTADSDQTDSVEDSEVVDVVELPAINVTKTADITSGADVGDVITYTIVVTNTGNETLTNVTVVDPLTGMSETITSLAPSASSTFTTTYTVTQADIDDSTGSNSGVDGDIDNTVTADSDQTGPDTASAEVTLDIRPGLSVTKVADVTSVNAVGDVITYTIVVTNTGNETLTNVTVVDPLTGMSETITSLAPSASSTFTTTYTVTQADIDDSTGSNSGVDGDIDNTVTADSDQTDSVEDSEVVDVVELPAINVTKTADITSGADVGDVITYTIVVTNTGNETLTNVTVVDPLTGMSETITSLAPSASSTFTTTYTVTQADIDDSTGSNSGVDGDIDNTVTADSDQTGPDTASAEVTLDIRPGLSVTKVADVTSVNAVGDVITYTIVVTNTGNETLTNVTVVDPLTGMSETITSLAPSASSTFTTTYTVTQADIDDSTGSNSGVDGDIDNTVTADSDQTDSVEDSEVVDVVELPAINVTKTADITSGADVGDVITYTIVVTNTGNETLTNVTVVDPLTGMSETITSLAPSASSTFTTTYTVTQADIDDSTGSNSGVDGDIDNTVTADSDQTGPDTASAEVTLDIRPGLSVTKVADVTSVNAVGDVITYTIVVTNTGNETLTNVTVVDPLTGMSETITSLAPSASSTFTTTYTVTQADIDDSTGSNSGVDGDIDNTVTADSDQTDSVEDSEVVDVVELPAINVTKTADITSGADVGDVITYTIVVTNTGNETLTNVTVVDPLTGMSETITSLAPSASSTFTTTYTVTQADIDDSTGSNSGVDGDIDNTVTADSDQTGPDTASAEVTLDIRPGLSVTKVADVTSVNAVGDVITYTIVVTNTGNETLTNVTVVDPLTGMSETITSLAPSASSTFTTTYTVTQADIDDSTGSNSGVDGDIDNTVTADSDQTDSVEDSEVVDVVELPAINVTKTADITSGADVGDVITYTIVVTNTGNETLTNVTVVDPLTGMSETITSLAPSASSTFTTTYTVTQADIDDSTGSNSGVDGDIDNTVTADSDQTGPDTASAEVTLDIRPGLSVTKVADVTSVNAVGDVITYTIVVTNTGNETLTNVTVVDPLTGMSETITSLAPSASSTFTTTYTVTQADIDDSTGSNSGVDGDIDNTVTADSDQTDSVEDSEVVDVVELPAINVTKTADITSGADVGDVITYTIVVTNTGNETLTNVTVVDPLTGMSETITSLAPSASSTFTTTYTVTQADIDDSTGSNSGVDGDIDNTVTADSDQTGPDTASAEVTLDIRPGLSVTKVADVTSVNAVGDVITYTIVVTNTGNETLTNVTVVDPLTGMSETITSLAPSASSTFTTTYTVTQADIDDSTGSNSGVDGDIDNTVTADSDQTDSVEDSEVVDVVELPAINVTKTADITSGADVGDVITYTIVVTNTGNETLTNVTVVDPLTGMSETITSLAPSASSTFTTTYTVTQADIDDSTGSNSGVDGDIDNTVTADSDQTGPDTASAEVTLDIRPGLSVTKVADVTSVNAVGDVITYTIVVTNTGNETLTNVTVVDPLTGMSETITSLAPSASSTFTTTYTVTQADIDDSTGSNSGVDGDIDNTVTADSDQTDSVEDSEVVDVVELPAINVTKTADITSGADVGDVITYTIVVTNTGNETLTNVTVVDPLTGMSETITSLAPSASSTFTTTYTVTQADIDDSTGSNSGVDGDIDNTVTADSDQTGPDTASAEVTLDIRPGLSVTKVADVTSVNAVGDVITYTIVVTNTGNETLTNVTVVDPLTGMSETITSLAPSASSTFTTTYTVTQADIDDSTGSNSGVDGDIDNTVTADSDQTDSVGGETMTSIIKSPELKIIKTAQVNDLGSDSFDHTTTQTYEGRVDSAGDQITYTLKISNQGNTSLSNVKVYDTMFDDMVNNSVNYENLSLDGQPVTLVFDRDANNQQIGRPYVLVGSLSVNAEQDITYTYIVTQADLNENTDLIIGDFDIDNTSEADSDQTDVVEASYTVDLVTYISDVAIYKEASLNSATVGSEVLYTLKVVNEGDTSLSDIVVSDQMFTDSLTDFNMNVEGQQFTVVVHQANGQTRTFEATVTGETLSFGGESLAAGEYAVINYSYIVNSADFTQAENVVYSIYDYTNGNGPQLDDAGNPAPVTFSYGSFSAYVNKVTNQLYGVGGDTATVYVNNDNTGNSVGVNSGVMTGDKNGNQDHLKMDFEPSPLDPTKSLVEGVSIVFTNATTVELAFRAGYGDNQWFTGSVSIGAQGNSLIYNLSEVSGETIINTNTTLIAPDSYSYEKDGDSIYTLDVAPGPGGAQNLLYTLTFNPENSLLGNINSFDFWVVGDLSTYSAEQIKVVDVKFDVMDYGGSSLVNTASVTSDLDGALNSDLTADETDSVTVNLLTDLTAANALIAQALGETSMSIKDTADNILALSSNLDKNFLSRIKVVKVVNNEEILDLEGQNLVQSNSAFEGVSFDTTSPTITITDSTNSVTKDNVTYTFTFSEAVTGFAASDITVTGGTKGTFTPVSATEYRLVVTPNVNSTTPITVNVASGAAGDAAGNQSAAVSDNSQAVDTVAPTVTITDNVAGTATGPVTYTFTFSEAVTGFDASDITVTGGTKGTFTPVSATEYRLVVTPNVNSTTPITVNVASGAAGDAAGNQSAAVSDNSQAVDTVAPTVTITDNVAGTATGPVTYTFTFSEAVTGFDASDITVTGGTKGTFTPVSATEYTLVVTPNANSTTPITVNVASGAAGDAAGNQSAAVSDNSQAVDTVAPTVTITDNVAGTATGPVTYTFTFSEAVNGFTDTDISVTGGTKGSLTKLSDSVYTMVVTPTANSTTSMKVNVAANVATDVAGNQNTAATESVQTVRTISDVEATEANNSVSIYSSGPSSKTLTLVDASISITDADGVITRSIIWQQFDSNNSIWSDIDTDNNNTFVATTWGNSDKVRVVIITTDPYNNTTRFTSAEFIPNTLSSNSSSPTAIALNRSAAPILVDMDGDGIEYLSKSAGVSYDFTNDGIADKTAWVSSDDGILGVKQANGTFKFVFSSSDGETDLQGLAKDYDENQDNLLNSQDADFSNFAIWQDADSDAVLDDGELITLGDAGIVELKLVSDGILRTAADGEVDIAGQTTYTRADGSTGLADDASFQYEPSVSGETSDLVMDQSTTLKVEDMLVDDTQLAATYESTDSTVLKGEETKSDQLTAQPITNNEVTLVDEQPVIVKIDILPVDPNSM